MINPNRSLVQLFKRDNRSLDSLFTLIRRTLRPHRNALHTPSRPGFCSLTSSPLPCRSAGKSQRTARHDPLGSFNPGSMLPASRLIISYHVE
ncbi:MAG: hypothetical protein IK126_02095 [Bacteroidales bacterium]|nr:hypothetical protein [Bacteroidales bacterium]